MRLMCWENLAGKHACTTLLCVSNRLGRFAIGFFGCRAISSRNSTYRMEKQCGLCLVLLLLLAAGVRNGLCRRPVLRVPRHAPTTGRYTVVLKQNTSVAELQQVLTRVLRISDGEKVYGYVEKVAKAFTVQLPSYALELVRRFPEVDYIEEEGIAAGTQDKELLWYLDRIDQSQLPLNYFYNPIGDGSGVDVYVLDTGINYDHEEFEYRAKYGGFDPVDEYERATPSLAKNGSDCHGHGTHVASLCGGKTYGSAKKVTLYSIRVLQCNNTAPWSTVLQGMDYVARVITQKRRPAIVLLALAGPFYRAMNDAVESIVRNQNVHVITVAGNGRNNSCTRSPASSEYAVTVAGTRSEDGLYVLGSGTNYGACVDIFAPGELIFAADHRCQNCSKYQSGTSMAAPIVCGVAAIHLSQEPLLTPAELKQKLIDESIKNVINYTGMPNNYKQLTPNRLLHVPGSCGGNIYLRSHHIITSPNFPQAHPNNLYCVWTILGENVTLTFTYLSLERNYDVIRVYNGCFANRSSIITELTGELGSVSRSYNSTGKALTLVLTTDGTETRGGFNVTCTTVAADPCTNNSGGCAHICTSNINGDILCSCRTGYRLDSNGKTCNDVNECAANTDGCQHICTNTNGSYTCSCRTGYSLSGNGRNCTDTNECTAGTHNCQQVCSNIQGSFTCSCRSGFTLNSDGHTCKATCSSNNGGCGHICMETPTGVRCSCRNGYRLAGDSQSCTDIDECSEGTDQCSQVCTNTPGSYQCACNMGYSLQNTTQCQDVDECVSNTHQCSTLSGAFCLNTIGSYNCSCPSGYHIDASGFTCVDTDECALRTFECGERYVCNNTDGSYECVCRPGYQLSADKESCEDVNECEVNNGGCDGNCSNTVGSYQCGCDPWNGLILDEDGLSCRNPVSSSCTAGRHGCPPRDCSTATGCQCDSGYQLGRTGRFCHDINECTQENTDCEQGCLNKIGSYKCHCFVGYQRANATHCMIRRCEIKNGDCQHDCFYDVDGVGRCKCRNGRVMDPVRERKCWVPTNPNRPAGAICGLRCDDRCVQEGITFRCECNPGRVLQSDGISCRETVTTQPATNSTTLPPTRSTTPPPTRSTTLPPTRSTTPPPTRSTTPPPTRSTTPPPTRSTTPPPTRSTTPPPTRSTTPPPTRSTTPPPTRSTTPPPTRSTTPPPIRSTTPPPTRSTTPPPTRSTTPPPTRSTTPPPIRSTTPPPTRSTTPPPTRSTTPPPTRSTTPPPTRSTTPPPTRSTTPPPTRSTTPPPTRSTTPPPTAHLTTQPPTTHSTTQLPTTCPTAVPPTDQPSTTCSTAVPPTSRPPTTQSTTSPPTTQLSPRTTHSTTQPPTTQQNQPHTTDPTTQPLTTHPPTTQSTTQPPTTQPPTTQQPTTQPPTTQPPTTSRCGSHLTSATGAFQTPNWPLGYPTNTDCEWTIELPDTRKVANLTFSSMLFSIPGGGSSCSEAYVEILANEGVSISLGRFCGSSIPSPITSSTNKIKVVFHGGTTLSGFVGGFGLSYESVNLEGQFSCNANYYSVGSATNNPSSFGPQGFPALIRTSTQQYCTWRFYGNTGTRYQFRLMYFDIPENRNCSQNKLTIRDGYIAVSPIIATLCGNISTLSFKSTGNDLTVILETNSNTFKGFHGVFEGV